MAAADLGQDRWSNRQARSAPTWPIGCFQPRSSTDRRWVSTRRSAVGCATNSGRGRRICWLHLVVSRRAGSRRRQCDRRSTSTSLAAGTGTTGCGVCSCSKRGWRSMMLGRDNLSAHHTWPSIGRLETSIQSCVLSLAQLADPGYCDRTPAGGEQIPAERSCSEPSLNRRTLRRTGHVARARRPAMIDPHR